jgi:hypothetical protein
MFTGRPVGAWALIDRLDAHQSHQALQPFAIDHLALRLEPGCHPPRAVKWRRRVGRQHHKKNGSETNGVINNFALNISNQQGRREISCGGLQLAESPRSAHNPCWSGRLKMNMALVQNSGNPGLRRGTVDMSDVS